MPKLLAPEYGGVWSWEGELLPSTMLKLSDGREVSLGSLITQTNGDVLEWLDEQQVEKHLAGQHDQSTHGHPSIGKIPAKPSFKETGYSELDNLAPKKPEAWEAINYYVNGGSTPLNGGLRAGKAPAGYQEDFDKNKKILEDAILANTVAEDITVQRWMVSEAFGMEQSELPSLIGKTYADKAFMSTATMRDKDGNALAENWANVSSYNVRMKISVPKGTNALRINSLESEILFKPNQPMYIHDVRIVDNYVEIDASMVND
jgi:hypothetical protein